MKKLLIFSCVFVALYSHAHEEKTPKTPVVGSSNNSFMKALMSIDRKPYTEEHEKKKVRILKNLQKTHQANQKRTNKIKAEMRRIFELKEEIQKLNEIIKKQSKVVQK